MKRFLFVLIFLCCYQYVFSQYHLHIRIWKSSKYSNINYVIDVPGFQNINGRLNDDDSSAEFEFLVDKIPYGIGVEAGYRFAQPREDYLIWDEENCSYIRNKDNSYEGGSTSEGGGRSDPTTSESVQIDVAVSSPILFGVKNVFNCVEDGTGSVEITTTPDPEFQKLCGYYSLPRFNLVYKVTCQDGTFAVIEGDLFQGLSLSYQQIQSALGGIDIMQKELKIEVGYNTYGGIVYTEPINGIVFIPKPKFSSNYDIPECAGPEGTTIHIYDLPDFVSSAGSLRLDVYKLILKPDGGCLNREYSYDPKYCWFSAVTKIIPAAEISNHEFSFNSTTKFEDNKTIEITNGFYGVAVAFDNGDSKGESFCPFHYEFPVELPAQIEVKIISLDTYTDLNKNEYHTKYNGGTATANITITGRDDYNAYEIISPATASLAHVTGTTFKVTGLKVTGLKADENQVIQVKHGNCESEAVDLPPISEPGILSVCEGDIKHVTCSGDKKGAVNFTITGGLGPYKVTLSADGHDDEVIEKLKSYNGSFDELSGGDYTIMVEDLAVKDRKIVASTSTFIIKEATEVLTNTPPIVNQIKCNGGKGSFSLKAKGGMSPYDYYFDNGSEAEKTDQLPAYTFVKDKLAGDTYTCKIVDALGCSTGDIPITINAEPDPIVVSTPVLNSLRAVNGIDYHTTTKGGLATAELTITGRADNNYEIISPTGVTLTYNIPDDSFTLNGLKAVANPTFQVKQGECFSNLKTVPTINEPIDLSVSVIDKDITDVACYGDKTGVVNFTIEGGFGPYTVELLPKTKEDDIKIDYKKMDGSFTGLPEGTYTIRVTDIASGLDFELEPSFSIEQPSDPLAFDLDNIIQENPHCFGGADGVIELAAKGGTSPYKYSIARQPVSELGYKRDDLPDGTHICIVQDDKECVSPEKKIVLTHPNALVLSELSKTNASCAEASNGAVTLSLAGGYDADAKELMVSLSRIRIPDNVEVFKDESRKGRNFTIKGLKPDEYQASVKVNDFCDPVTIDFTIEIISEDKQFQITKVDIKPASCDLVHNGELAISVDNGNSLEGGGYEFLFNGASKPEYIEGTYINGLYGNLKYKVELTDANNCSASRDNISIGIDADRLKMQTSYTPSTCDVAKNGEILLKWENGKAKDHSKTPHYFYKIDRVEPSKDSLNNEHSFKGLYAGDHQVSVMDDAGCIVSELVKLPAKVNPISFDLGSVAESCKLADNGSIEISNLKNRDLLELSYEINGKELKPVDVPSTKNKIYKGLDAGSYSIKISDTNTCAFVKSIVVRDLNHSPTANLNVLDSLACKSSSEGRVNFVELCTPDYESNLTHNLYDSKNKKLTSLLGQDLVFENLNNQQYTFILTDEDKCEHRLRVKVPVKKDAVRFTKVNMIPSSCVRAHNGIVELEASGGKPFEEGYFFGLKSPSAVLEGRDDYIVSSYGANARFEGLSVLTKFIVVVKDKLLCVDATKERMVTVNRDSLQIFDANTIDPLCYETQTGEIKPVLINNKEGLSYNYSIAKKNAKGEYEAMPDNHFEGESLTYKDLGDGNYKIIVVDSENCQADYDEIVLDNPAKAKIVETSFNYIRKKGDKEGEFEFTFSGVDKNFDYTLKNVDSDLEIEKGSLSYSAPASDLNKKIDKLPAGNYIFKLTDVDACLDFDGSDTYVEPFKIREPVDALFQTNEKLTDVRCKSLSDGAIDISGFGGWGDYSYSMNGTDWQKTGSYTNLKAGDYSILIKDSTEVSYLHPFSISEPDTLNVFIDKVKDATCPLYANGKLSATSINGIPFDKGLNYWLENVDDRSIRLGDLYSDNSYQFKKLPKGNYELFVSDSHSCEASKPFSISEPDTAKIQLTHNYIKAKDDATGEISLKISEGNGVFDYKCFLNEDSEAFETGQTKSTIDLNNLQAGAYKILVRDTAGCAYEADEWMERPIEMREPSLALGFKVDKDTVVSCNGLSDGKIKLNAIGGWGDYSYSLDGAEPVKIGEFPLLPAGSYPLQISDSAGIMWSRDVMVIEPEILRAEYLSHRDVNCYGGSDGEIALKIEGGNSGYSLSLDEEKWIPGSVLNNLTKGIYNISLKDAKDCSAEVKNIEINQPDEIKLFSSVVIESRCSNNEGSINSEFQGGVGAYNYKWSKDTLLEDGSLIWLDLPNSNSSTLNNLFSSRYIVKVKDEHNCELSFDFALGDITDLAIERIDVKDVSCWEYSDGQALASVVKGNKPYTFGWDKDIPKTEMDSAWSMLAGTYNLLVRDAKHCAASGQFVVGTPDSLFYELQDLTQPLCYGGFKGQISLLGTGGTPDYQYSWTGGSTDHTIQELNPGLYTLKLSDSHNCESSFSFNLAYQRQLTPFIGNDTLICDYNSLLVNGGDYAQYRWTSNFDFSSGKAEVELTEPGNYYLEVEDDDSCLGFDTLLLDVSYLKIEDLQTTDVTCHALANGSAQIEITPKDWEHTVRWPDASSDSSWMNLSGGTYNVEVEDVYACQDSLEFFIYEPDTLDLDIEKLTHPICSDVPNGLIQITAKGGNGDYSYLWADGSKKSKISALDEGAYSVSISDKKDCKISRDFKLNYQKSVQNDLGLDFLGKDTLICHYNSLSLDGRDYAKHYWTSDAGFSSKNRIVELTEPGNYYLKIEDGDKCMAYDSLHLAVSYLEIDDLKITDVTCYGLTDGNAQIMVSPEGWQHTISWSDGSAKPKWNNLSGGAYQVQVKDKYNCQDTRAFLINEPDTLDLEIKNLVQPLCFGVPNGFIRLKPYGGNGDYSYLWEHGDDNKRLTGLDEGNYKVHISDKKGCQISHSFNLAYQRTIYPDLGEDLTLCTDNYVNLYPGEFYEYKWKASGMVLGTDSELLAWQADKYSVEVKDEDGCIASDQIRLTEKQSDLAPIILSASSIAQGDTLMVMEVSQPKPESLTWEFTGAHKITEQGDFYCKLIFLEEGMFEMKLTAHLDGCIGQTQQPILVVPAQSTDEDGDAKSSDTYAHLSKLSVFPNPTDGPFEAEVELAEVADVTFYLVNIQSGKIMEKRNRKGLKVYREAYNLSKAGVYCIYAESLGERKIFKLVVI